MQSNFRHQGSPPEEWPADDDTSFSHQYHYPYGDQAPPYAGLHELHEPYGMSPSASPAPVSSPHDIPPVSLTLNTGGGGVHQRQPFPHSLSSPHILSPPMPATSPQEMRVALPVRRTQDVERAAMGAGLGLGTSPSLSVGSTSTVNWKRAGPPGVEVGVMEVEQREGDAAGRERIRREVSRRAHRRNDSNLHPYVRGLLISPTHPLLTTNHCLILKVMTFTSPIGESMVILQLFSCNLTSFSLSQTWLIYHRT